MKKKRKAKWQGFKEQVTNTVQLKKPVEKMSLRERISYWQSQFNEMLEARRLQDTELRILRHDLDTNNQRLCRYERIIDRLTGVRE